ncbi:MAG TPA: FABP family protein [Ilumatobacter sp.]|nr:FABP family protein [Ilumatobacter sp.]
MAVALHPNVEILSPLLGAWEGRGSGEYPTIDGFDYLEWVAFTHVGKPFLTYSQRTVAADDGRPLHSETGYLRALEGNRVELVLAHPTGITELDEGSIETTADGLILTLGSTTIGLSGSAKTVTAVERHIELDGDELRYRVAMAAVGQPMTHHLQAHLARTP